MGDLIYVVTEGELEIIRELASGGEELRKAVTSGDYFGEIGPVFHMPRSATVRARTDAEVVGYTARAFPQRPGLRAGATGQVERTHWLGTVDSVDPGSPVPLPPDPEGYSAILTFVATVLQ